MATETGFLFLILKLYYMWVYIHSEHSADRDLYTVGFFAPNGEFMPESDWESSAQAANRCHFLNGGDRIH